MGKRSVKYCVESLVGVWPLYDYVGPHCARAPCEGNAGWEGCQQVTH